MPAAKTSSKSKKFLIAAGVLAAGIVIYTTVHKSSTSTSDTAKVLGIAPGDFHGIPPEGIGGDPDLNRKKNRWNAPAEVTIMNVSDIMALPHAELSSMGKEKRSRWSSSAESEASACESKGVQVTGYLAHAKESGNESCNGNSEIYHDFHLWLTASPDEDKRNGIIIETTPFWKEQFPVWQLKTFEKLASEHVKIRITGWILWDEEHGDEVGKSRGSLWEVHPVTKFEVLTGGRWEDINGGNIP